MSSMRATRKKHSIFSFSLPLCLVPAVLLGLFLSHTSFCHWCWCLSSFTWSFSHYKYPSFSFFSFDHRTKWLSFDRHSKKKTACSPFDADKKSKDPKTDIMVDGEGQRKIRRKKKRDCLVTHPGSLSSCLALVVNPVVVFKRLLFLRVFLEWRFLSMSFSVILSCEKKTRSSLFLRKGGRKGWRMNCTILLLVASVLIFFSRSLVCVVTESFVSQTFSWINDENTSEDYVPEKLGESQCPLAIKTRWEIPWGLFFPSSFWCCFCRDSIFCGLLFCSIQCFFSVSLFINLLPVVLSQENRFLCFISSLFTGDVVLVKTGRRRRCLWQTFLSLAFVLLFLSFLLMFFVVASFTLLLHPSASPENMYSPCCFFCTYDNNYPRVKKMKWGDVLMMCVKKEEEERRSERTFLCRKESWGDKNHQRQNQNHLLLCFFFTSSLLLVFCVHETEQSFLSFLSSLSCAWEEGSGIALE